MIILINIDKLSIRVAKDLAEILHVLRKNYYEALTNINNEMTL